MMIKSLFSFILFTFIFIQAFAGHEGNGTGPVQGLLQRSLVQVNEILKIPSNREGLAIDAMEVESSSYRLSEWRLIFEGLYETSTKILKEEERYLEYDFSSEKAFDAENEKTWMVHQGSKIKIRPRVYSLLFGVRVNPRQIFLDLIHELLHFQLESEEKIHSIQTSVTKVLAKKMQLDRIYASYHLNAWPELFRSESSEDQKHLRCGFKIIQVTNDLSILARFIANPPAKKSSYCDYEGKTLEFTWQEDLLWTAIGFEENISLKVSDFDRTDFFIIQFRGQDIPFYGFDLEKHRKIGRQW